MAREKEKEKIRLEKLKIIQEKKKLKTDIFKTKHSGKIRVAKNIGRGFKIAGGNLKANFRGAISGFQEQRKKKKGIGGWLQNIADNQ